MPEFNNQSLISLELQEIIILDEISKIREFSSFLQNIPSSYNCAVYIGASLVIIQEIEKKFKDQHSLIQKQISIQQNK